MIKIPLPPFESALDPKTHIVCGLDEAGRGPLVGDVTAGCVILNPNDPIEGLADSKKLSEKKRFALEIEIKNRALAYGIGVCSAKEIDELNILEASMEAMRRAFRQAREMLQHDIELALVDGNRVPSGLGCEASAVVKGDARVSEISAASILAKTERDRRMIELDKIYPAYGFAKHKGYPTAAHLKALAELPVLDCYRRSYAPVRAVLAQRGLM